MATFTFPTDQTRLVLILGLDRDQLKTDSTLNYLMDEAERQDTAWGIDTVTLILAAMTAIEGFRTSLGALTREVSDITVVGEYSAKYTSTNADNYERLIAEQLAIIARFLDPDQQFLGVGSARVYAS